MRLTSFEIFLLQIIFYALLWLWDEYVASYICIIFPVVIGVILLISWIADLIEPARVGRMYFVVMGISIVCPLLTGLVFYIIYDGNLAWLQQ